MSDRIDHEARPREDYSTACFHREAVALQQRFAGIASGVTKRELRRRLWALSNYLYWSEAPLTDGYMPLGTVYLRTPRGKLAVVFPHSTDEKRQDGTTTDRSLTVHFIGDVSVADMIQVSIALHAVLDPLETPPAVRQASPEPAVLRGYAW